LDANSNSTNLSDIIINGFSLLSTLTSKQVAITAASPLLLDTSGNLSLDSTKSITCAGLTTTSDILLTNASACNITASSALNLSSNSRSLSANTSLNTGSYLTLGSAASSTQYPTGNFQLGTNDTTYTLVDLKFATSNGITRVIRQESRASNAKCGVGSFHIGGQFLDEPTFAIGDTYCAVGNKLTVGSYGYPVDPNQFYVNGNSHDWYFRMRLTNK